MYFYIYVNPLVALAPKIPCTFRVVGIIKLHHGVEIPNLHSFFEGQGCFQLYGM